MSALPPGIEPVRIATDRIETHVLRRGPDDGIPVVLVHGNVSSGRFFAELMASLPAEWHILAPDLRGFGDSEVAPVNATRGVDDFADDLLALFDALGLATAERPVHLVGWSVGGGVIQRVAMKRPEGVASLLLEAPMAPFGFGGTKDAAGTQTTPDWAGTGGGTANPDFVARLGQKDTGTEGDASPRNVMRAFYMKSPKLEPAIEDAYVEAMVKMSTAPANYPGDVSPAASWPAVAPGEVGVNNAISGKYCDLSGFSAIEPKPRVLWVRGADDMIVSDTSMFDLGQLGKLGAVPGWPGEEIYPPQPMIAQTRAVLDAYANGGGKVDEEVLEECGHSPHLEQPERFRELLVALVSAQ